MPSSNSWTRRVPPGRCAPATIPLYSWRFNSCCRAFTYRNHPFQVLHTGRSTPTIQSAWQLGKSITRGIGVHFLRLSQATIEWQSSQAARSFEALGMAWSDFFSYKDALGTFQKALACALKQARQRSLIVRIYMKIVTNLPEALNFLRLSRDMWEELQGTKTIGFADIYESCISGFRSPIWCTASRSTRAGVISQILSSWPPTYCWMLARTSKAELNSGNDDAAERTRAEPTSVYRRSQTQCAAAGCPRRKKADGLPLEIAPSSASARTGRRLTRQIASNCECVYVCLFLFLQKPEQTWPH